MGTDEPPRRAAAVLVPLFRDAAGALRVVLIRRAERGRHAGQIALPGGNHETSDADLRATAVREACEELAVTADTIEVLAELPPALTRTTGYAVTPFVARIRPAVEYPVLVHEPGEVQEIFAIDAAAFLDDASAGEETFEFPGWDGPRRMPVRRVDGRLIWGLTLRVLEPTLRDALAGKWPV